MSKQVKVYPSNDPCPCGSGKKYLECCLDKPYKYVIDETGKVTKRVVKPHTPHKVPRHTSDVDLFHVEGLEYDSVVVFDFRKKDVDSVKSWIPRDWCPHCLLSLISAIEVAKSLMIAKLPYAPEKPVNPRKFTLIEAGFSDEDDGDGHTSPHITIWRNFNEFSREELLSMIAFLEPYKTEIITVILGNSISHTF